MYTIKQTKGDMKMTPALRKSLREARNQIESAIREDINNRRTPKDTVTKFMNEMDIDTVKWFLAETVKAADWDGRYSKRTKQWAAQLYIPVLHGEDGREYGQINAHPAHINQIIEAL